MRSRHLTLTSTQPYDAHYVLNWLGTRAVSGMEQWDGSGYMRALMLDDGPALVRLSAGPDGVSLKADILATTVADVERAVSVAEWVCAVDVDVQQIAEHFRHLPWLSEASAEFPGLRVPRCASVHEAALRALVGQQVSLQRGLALITRAVELNAASVQGLRPLLSQEQLSETLNEWFKGPGRRREAIREAMSLDMSDPHFDEAFADIRGVGPWTIAYTQMRGLGSLDADMSGDLAILKAAKAVARVHDKQELKALLKEASPYRSYATAYLVAAHSRSDEIMR